MSQVLITGGAGFVGTNLAKRFLTEGRRVILLDNFSRPGVRFNLEQVRSFGSGRLNVVEGDVRDFELVSRLVKRADFICHLAAQVAVTSSVVDPRADFETNVLGSLNLLEAMRLSRSSAPIIFTSTNKVYGEIKNLRLKETSMRYSVGEEFSESLPLSFETPYGCSKGAADQYFLDYSRIYGIRSLVFRMSCIYGRYQQGNEDQGWVAHITRRVVESKPISIFGDGKQVRDLLYIDDLVDAFEQAEAMIDKLKGRAFNLGGGRENAISLLDLLSWLETKHGRLPEVRFQNWRPNDQKYYVSDIRLFSELACWKPRWGLDAGLTELYNWLGGRSEAGKLAAL